MTFKSDPTLPSIVRPRVTPHPDHAAELQRRMESLTYHPQNGFHRDLRKTRQEAFGNIVRTISYRFG